MNIHRCKIRKCKDREIAYPRVKKLPKQPKHDKHFTAVYTLLQALALQALDHFTLVKHELNAKSLIVINYDSLFKFFLPKI